MIKNITIIITTLFSVIFLNVASFAADTTVEMLNKQGKESMVYSQKIVKINVGDKVIWKATDKGHNVEFIKGGVPEGVEKFKSKYNQDVEFKFDVPGIYAYWCTPHKSMGMIGFVLVGNDKSNLEAIKTIRYSGKSKKIAPDLINTL
ncbi:pseudoazurin [Candidatus Pelagibacter sp.]|jgi:pseudoazurin|nr:pseudoazurin [Candidatus Pelagibacter sp.]|tara:strand:+ start:67 stop:507 length:441 start_codon:yes stop_codon:yes gene_type:complete